MNNSSPNIFLLTETNFILDISFEQAPECGRLFLLLQEQGIDLIIPEYSFAEAEGNISRTLHKRKLAIDSAIEVLRQSGRSRYQEVASLITQLEQFKVYSATQELSGLHAKMQEVAEIASLILFHQKSPYGQSFVVYGNLPRLKNRIVMCMSLSLTLPI